jgi:Cys-tRNA(Pro) deacylase
MSFLTKEPVQRAEKYLKEFDTNLEVISLETSARTAAEAASSLKCGVGAIVKSLLFSADDKFILCLVSGDKKASLNKLKKNLNINNIEMAKAEDVKQITGYTIGGVSPVGHLKKVNIYIDKNLDRFNELYAAAGHPNCVFKISFINLVQITNGSILDITE